ncbi:MAG TPA: GNAT family N-acetyltransferase [Steroidobacteraceae bacterium]|nr:GNAT family N-acetyltransferase [Steroidobacteraceae bacterium]
MPKTIAVADTDEAIDACYPVMSELRPKITREEFLPFVKRLAATNNFRLAFLDDDGIRAVAGYRVSEWLAGGRYLEIEDLVTADGSRSRGYGGELFDWLMDEAARANCRQVRLVSNVKRVDAHRFYLRKGMKHEAHYFSINVNPSE